MDYTYLHIILIYNIYIYNIYIIYVCVAVFMHRFSRLTSDF